MAISVEGLQEHVRLEEKMLEGRTKRLPTNASKEQKKSFYPHYNEMERISMACLDARIELLKELIGETSNIPSETTRQQPDT